MNLGFQAESAKGAAELDPVAEFTQGVKLLNNGYPQKALACLRRAFESEKQNPYYMSFLGVSIARAQRKWDQALKLCEIAVQLKRAEVQFHLNLADVYAAAGRRENALDTLDSALELLGEDKRLRGARNKVEKRRTPVLPFLTREHFLNRELGKMRHRALKRLRKENP
jgi:tetratricopeptide (TPR) repeat protein